jgi:hypothetical protein
MSNGRPLAPAEHFSVPSPTPGRAGQALSDMQMTSVENAHTLTQDLATVEASLVRAFSILARLAALGHEPISFPEMSLLRHFDVSPTIVLLSFDAAFGSFEAHFVSSFDSACDESGAEIAASTIASVASVSLRRYASFIVIVPPNEPSACPNPQISRPDQSYLQQ